MTNIATFVVAGVSLGIWIYLIAGHGTFWRFGLFVADEIQVEPPSHLPRVVAIVPARNEAESIAQCVVSLVRQEYDGEFLVVVVDDHSEDGTGWLAKETAKCEGAAERVRIVCAKDLPSGWAGKVWAMEQGVQQVSGLAPEYFWFTDADVVHAPATLRGLVTRAERGGLDLVSLMVLLQANTLPERLLIPPFVYFFLQVYPPRWSAKHGARTAGAAGGCILLRRTALEQSGGLEGIRGAVIDDCELARAVKSSGGRIWWGLTRSSISLRNYRSFGEIRDMIARTAFTQLDHSPLLLGATLVGLLLTYIAPIMLLFAPEPTAKWMGFLAWILMSMTFVPTLRFYKQSALWAPALPLAGVFYAWATLLSAVRYWRGRGGQWKGRSQVMRRI